MKPKERADYAKKIYNVLKKSEFAFFFYYFPHHFRDESPSFHIKMLNDAKAYRFYAAAAPRSFAKSTVIAFGFPIHRITFELKRHIVIISNTYGKSAQILETIKSECRDNSRFKNDFHIKISKDREGDSIFSSATGFKTRVLCKGAEQMGSIRGEKFGAYRPDLIIVDDLEDDEMVKNPERRRDLERVYGDAVEPAIDEKTGEIKVIGTVLHDDSLMAKFVSEDKYINYKKGFFQARYSKADGNSKSEKAVSLWESKRSVEWLNNLEKTDYIKFAKEYQNNPVSGKMARFNKEQFRYWNVTDGYAILINPDGSVERKYHLSDCKGAIACDLAWSEKKEADSSVLMPGFLTPDSDILIDNYICKKGLRPHQFVEALFSMELRVKTLTNSIVPIGFEKAMLEKVTQWILKQEMRKQNRFLLTKELKWETDKITRIETVLEPRYAQGIIYHRRNMGELEHQLIRFPSGVHDDVIDAAQSLCRLLQNPKQIKKTPSKDDQFMLIRQMALESVHPNKKVGAFNLPERKFYGIPTRISHI